MLVLSRRQGQTIRIGNQIILTVQRAHGSCKLAIDAPPQISIVRDDVRSNQPRATAPTAAPRKSVDAGDLHSLQHWQGIDESDPHAPLPARVAQAVLADLRRVAALETV